jgi:hypothetical protein
MSSAADPYADLPDDHLLAPAPLVHTAADNGVVLYDWLRKEAGEGVWEEIVTEMYAQAATVPMVASYFGGIDLPELQRHFLAALVMVTSRGMNVGTVRRMAQAHVPVHNEQGEPITGAAYDAVVATLAGIMLARGVPQDTLGQVGALVGPLRTVIVINE